MTHTGAIFKQSEMLLKYPEDANTSTDKDLLTEILQKYEGDPWLRITHMELKSACNTGDNYMSTVQRAYVEGFTTNDKPFSKYFIMKRQMDNSERREMLHVDQVWANEAHMYFTVMPRLRRHCTTDLPHPKLYYSDKNLMVMEDLKEKGYSMVDRFVGMNLEHSLMVMKALALFHSSSLAMKILDDEMFEIMKGKLKHPYNDQVGIDMGKIFIKQTMESANALFQTPPHDGQTEKLLAILKHLQDNFTNYVQCFNKNSCNRDLSVVIHGDIWVNNILFSYESNTRKPKVCKFVDFQGTRFGSLAIDILQFIYTSVQPEIRKQHYKLLIKTYHDSLISYLESFVGHENAVLVKNITIEKIEEEIQTFRIYGLLNAIMMLPVVTFENPSPNHGSNAILNMPRTYSQTYKGRLLDVLEEYSTSGWV